MFTKKKIAEDLFSQYGYRPKKKLGQNFLIDRNLVDKITRELRLGRHDIVLEIGAGLGILTSHIADLTKMVYAVELDKMLCGILSDDLTGYSNIRIINEDILSQGILGKEFTEIIK